MPTFVVETYGCQMNVHDSERIAGLLLDAGYTQALADSQPDLVVFNTCAVRENADNKLFGIILLSAAIFGCNLPFLGFDVLFPICHLHLNNG